MLKKKTGIFFFLVFLENFLLLRCFELIFFIIFKKIFLITSANAEVFEKKKKNCIEK